MKRQFLLFLYPPQWRRRYQQEMEALLDDTELRRSDYFDIVIGASVMWMESFVRRPAWQSVALLTFIGLITGAVASQTMRRVYISTATLQGSGSPELTESLLKDAVSRKRLTTVINELNLYGEDRKRKPLEDVVEQMRNDTHIWRATPREKGAISVAFAHSDPQIAQRVTREITANIIRAANITAIDPADLPATPASPNVRVVVSMGALCGLVAGALIGVLTARRRRPDHHSA